ncbi:Pectinesterase inhibitor domain protein [Actinidia chinensis var. chinensis]|uniref:Pectinesterase inhibitor domain protein n=1 Tax=Actinidia chinensis var. chinensis TaxID=1590841 RepID=A0A2R6R6E1_ACTCC|nr:Pectinesterase inhibitor domain protein [Actinidia chinensis var. chinensis]
MAKHGLSLLLLLLSTFCITGTTKGAGHPPSRARAFIVEQCQATRYPELCVQCLSNYPNASASQQELAQYALTMSLARAWYTRAYVTQVAAQLKQTKAKEYQAVKDCLDQINDGVGQLSQSIKELQRINHDREGNFSWHTSNVQTWLSTVLTEAMTCIDGFSGHAVGGKVRATIKAKVLNVAHMTSNALALFNRFVARHRATRSNAQP